MSTSAPATPPDPHAELRREIAALATELATASPHRIIEEAGERCGDGLAIAFSGAEDVLVLDIARQVGVTARVFTLDTGRLHPETHDYIERVGERYGVRIEVMSPDHAAVQALVARKGLFSFRVDGHKECCGVRKVEPLRRALRGASGWMTGQRRDQSPDTRADLAAVEIDAPSSTPARAMLKFNPMAAWTSARVWAYIRGAGIPYNALHDRGFVSIGCAPCTRPMRPGEHERAARWWWEEATRKECGLHLRDDDEG